MAVAESCFGKDLGVALNSALTTAQFFAETQGRFLISVKPENQLIFEQLMGRDATLLGKVTNQQRLLVAAIDGEFKLALPEAKRLWEGALACSLK